MLTKVIKSKRMSGTCSVGVIKNAYKILGENPEETVTLSKRRRRGKNNIKTNQEKMWVCGLN
jgi:hypothetical protein